MRKLFLFFSCLLVIFLFSSCDSVFSPNSPTEPGDIEVRRITVTVEYNRSFDRACACYPSPLPNIPTSVYINKLGPNAAMDNHGDGKYSITIKNVREDVHTDFYLLDNYFYEHGTETNNCEIRAHNVIINGVEAPYKMKSSNKEYVPLRGFDENNKPIFN